MIERKSPFVLLCWIEVSCVLKANLNSSPHCANNAFPVFDQNLCAWTDAFLTTHSSAQLHLNIHHAKSTTLPLRIAHHSKSSINGALCHKGENLHISAHPDTPSSPSMDQAPGIPNRQMFVVPVDPNRAGSLQTSS